MNRKVASGQASLAYIQKNIDALDEYHLQNSPSMAWQASSRDFKADDLAVFLLSSGEFMAVTLDMNAAENSVASNAIPILGNGGSYIRSYDFWWTYSYGRSMLKAARQLPAGKVVYHVGTGGLI